MADAVLKRPRIAAVSALFAAALLAAFAVDVGEALSQCGKDCMPICLKVDGATVPACEQGCDNYCKQTGGGRGGGGGSPLDFSKVKIMPAN